jgi:hypothetical protein
MGAPLVKSCDPEGKEIKGASCLYTILISESTHLIWKLRCESVIDRLGADITNEEAYARLSSAINGRLQNDISLSNKKRWGQHAIPQALVLATWSLVIIPTDKYSLPPN